MFEYLALKLVQNGNHYNVLKTINIALKTGNNNIHLLNQLGLERNFHYYIHTSQTFD